MSRIQSQLFANLLEGQPQDEGVIRAEQGNLSFTREDPATGETTLIVQGDPHRADRIRDENQHRRQFQELVAQRANIERRKEHMNPRAYTSQAAGLEYDMAKFESGMQEEFARQRNIRNSSRDLETLATAFRNNEIDEQVFFQGMNSIEREYGQGLLMQNQAYRQLKGVEGDFQEAEVEAQTARAEQLGVPPEALRRDPRSGEFEFDRNWLIADQRNTEKQKEALKPALEMQKIKQQMATERYKNELNNIEAEHRVLREVDPIAASKRRETAVNAAFKRLQESTTGIAEEAAEMTRSTLPEADTPQAPPATHPKLPTGASIAGRYSTPQELVAANPRKGSYVIGGGILFRVSQDGSLEEVE